MPTGNDKVIETLQASLGLHLTAIEAYSSQASHFERWGYPKLAEKAAAEAEDERTHAKRLMDRLEFFDVPPSLEHAPGEWPRHDFQGTLEANYGMETQAAEVERGGYTLALAADDPLTADLFRQNLRSSEESLAEIEAAREVIEQIGLDNYLANQT